MSLDPARITGIVVDVFSTAVDWRGTIPADGAKLDRCVDWPGVADSWLKSYRSSVEKVRLGKRPWANLDTTLLGEAFSDIISAFALERLGPEKFFSSRRNSSTGSCGQ